MKKVVHRKSGWVIIIVLLGIFLCILPLSNRKAFAREIADRVNITLYYRVRFEILAQSPKGLHYIDLFDRYTGEITQLAINHPSFFVDSLSIIQAWEPALDAFVNGRGEETIITDEAVKGVLAYLDQLSGLASPELKAVIEQERAIVPLEPVTGMTMNQAWVYLNQDPRFASPNSSETAHVDTTATSSSTVLWTIPEAPPLTMEFDPGAWELVSWSNGIATSWELRHRSLYDCVVTVPGVLTDPYSFLEIRGKTLIELPYEVRTSGISELTLYSIYTPLYISPAQIAFSFILYPGYVDTQACIDQTDVLLGNIHLSP
jgi:hypothetical protein